MNVKYWKGYNEQEYAIKKILEHSNEINLKFLKVWNFSVKNNELPLKKICWIKANTNINSNKSVSIKIQRDCFELKLYFLFSYY